MQCSGMINKKLSKGSPLWKDQHIWNAEKWYGMSSFDDSSQSIHVVDWPIC